MIFLSPQEFGIFYVYMIRIVKFLVCNDMLVISMKVIFGNFMGSRNIHLQFNKLMAF